MSASPGSAAPLAPYVPRLLIDWASTCPDTRFRRVEGTMVFIDISGFTALSERLARRGKAGAEELTDVLDGVFARLLLRAAALGGDLVKFGGDALLLLFTGGDHPARASAAAFDMREELASAGRVDTSEGHVALRMSVGVHSGAFELFLVGDSHRELVLTGPAASETVAAESSADADQILLSAGTAGLVDPAVLGDRVGDARLLVRRPKPTAGPPGDADDGPHLPLESCVPLALRRTLKARVREPEHRVVTICFVHFMGLDALLSSGDTARVTEALTAVIAAAQHHLDAHGVCFLGSDVYGDGGKLIFTAGAPEASENDEERMLRAVRGLFDEDLPLRLRAGVHRGHVYAGEVGSTSRRTYTVMGDAMNLAARLMQAAQAGDVLVTKGVLDRSPTTFATQPLEPFHVKGKSRPVEAHRLGHVVRWKRMSRVARLPLVGRQHEMQVLESALSAALGGHGRVVTIAGPAGIGKTRLVEEAGARAQDMTQLRILCEQYEQATPYWALRWLFRRVLDIPFDAEPAEAGALLRDAVTRLDPDLLPWLPLLAIPVDAQVPQTEQVSALDEAFRRDRLEQAAADLLSRVLVDPTLILVEDLHWMDDASKSLVRALCAAAASRPWLLVLTSRDVDVDFLHGDDTHVRVLRLAPLESDAAHALAAAASELLPLAPHELDELAERADGNPLFLIELIAGAAADRTGSLPDSIEAAITARIDTLDPADRWLVRSAAVLGLSFPGDLATAVLTASESQATGQVPDETAWDRLGEFLVRERDGRLRFRHALLRDVAYEGLPYRRRRDLHARIAEHLEAAARERGDSDASAEVLAFHFSRAERLRKAWRYARVAGERARAKAANVEAAAFYRQALDAARKAATVPAGEVAAVAELLGDVCELAGMYEEGVWAYRLARRYRRDDPLHLPDLFRKEGLIKERAGQYDHARLLYRRGLRLLDGLPDQQRASRARAHLQVLMAALLFLEGRYRATIWWARRAAHLAADRDVPEVLAHAYYLLDSGYTESGEQGLAKEYRGLALPIYEELGDLVGQTKVLNNLGAIAYFEGSWQEALSFYERGRQTAQRTGDLVHAAMLASNIAEVLLQQGHLDRAREMFSEALQVQRGAGDRRGEAWALANLGLAAARSGQQREGHALLTQARELFRELGAEWHVLEAGAGLVEVNLLGGDYRNARALALRSLEQVRARGGLPILEAMLHRLHGYAVLQSGDRDHAAAAFEASLAAAESAGAIYEMALTLDAKGRLAGLTGQRDDHAAERSASLLSDLGVVGTPDIPLPSPAQLGGALRPDGAG